MAFSWVFSASGARADLGQDSERVRRALAEQARSEALRFRLMERGELTPIVLPPWALDSAGGECTTLLLLAPVASAFVVHVHPWQNEPHTFASAAGAFQLTRCGQARISLLRVLVEMRSPRAVVYPFLAVGAAAPAPLSVTLPERDTGPEAELGEPGPMPAREPLNERLRRFEARAKDAGASATETALLPSAGQVSLALEPGCHRLLATGPDGAAPYTLLLSEHDDGKAERLVSSSLGDVQYELCTARGRRLRVSLDAIPSNAERKLSVAHFPLPSGLPGRLGPEVNELLLTSLGQSAAPRKLGTLVSTTLGAQGRTPLPRALLPQTCYLAAAIVLHGSPQALSLGVRAGAQTAEANGNDDAPAPHLGFCTGASGRVELDVEARGLGLTWLFFLFQMGPARSEAP